METKSLRYIKQDALYRALLTKYVNRYGHDSRIDYMFLAIGDMNKIKQTLKIVIGDKKMQAIRYYKECLIKENDYKDMTNGKILKIAKTAIDKLLKGDKQ